MTGDDADDADDDDDGGGGGGGDDGDDGDGGGNDDDGDGDDDDGGGDDGDDGDGGGDDADVLSTDATGGYSVHTNEDDFMQYIDCKISKEEYPDGCPVVNEDTLRISMALIGDYDGISNSARGYSMETGKDKGTDFGVGVVWWAWGGNLLWSPWCFWQLVWRWIWR